MLLLNRILLYVNVFILMHCLWTHDVLFAAISTMCMYLNLTAIKRLEENNGL